MSGVVTDPGGLVRGALSGGGNCLGGGGMFYIRAHVPRRLLGYKTADILLS